jgi:hypothetical protein
MRIALILIVQLFPFCIFSQNENNAIFQNSEMASFFNSYDITKEIKKEINIEELKQKKVESENGEEIYRFNLEDFESNKHNFNFNKVWVKKEIGYLSEFIKKYGISNWNDMKLKFSEVEKENEVISSYYENIPHGYWDFGNYKGEFKNGKIKEEGIVNQYRKEYDINGKLIRSSPQFDTLSIRGFGVH